MWITVENCSGHKSTMKSEAGKGSGMKVSVLGAGLMGKQASKDLVQQDAGEKVFLADLDVGRAELFKKQLGNEKLEVHHLDAHDDHPTCNNNRKSGYRHQFVILYV